MVQGPLSNFQEHILFISFSLIVFELFGKFGNVLQFSYPFYTTVAPAGRTNNLHNCVYIQFNQSAVHGVLFNLFARFAQL